MSPEARPRSPRSRWTLVLAALGLPVLASAPGRASAQIAPRAGWVEIEPHAGEHGTAWSVLATEVELAELVQALARRAGLALEGAELLPSRARLSVELAARPLEEVLAFVLGTRGMRAELGEGTLRVLAEPAGRDERLARAEAAWAEVEARGGETFPGEARLARGTLAEARGEDGRARALYATLPGGTPAGAALDPATPELLYRAGRLELERGEWSAAAQHFRRLAEAPGAFRERARLALARAQLALGDASAAASTLAATAVERDACAAAERRLLLARARMASAEPWAALRALDAGPTAPLRPVEARALAVRAEALATLGHPAEAARAWLAFAREGAGEGERLTALTRAAELALQDGDALAVLFVAREAEALGLASALAPLAAAARAALGLDADDGALPVEERIELAEALLETHPERAGELLDGLEREREVLPPLQQAHLLVARARLVARREGSGRALAMLAAGRADFAAPEARQALDRAAASLLEREGRFDAATDAYQGRY